MDETPGKHDDTLHDLPMSKSGRLTAATAARPPWRDYLRCGLLSAIVLCVGIMSFRPGILRLSLLMNVISPSHGDSLAWKPEATEEPRPRAVKRPSSHGEWRLAPVHTPGWRPNRPNTGTGNHWQGGELPSTPWRRLSYNPWHWNDDIPSVSKRKADLSLSPDQQPISEFRSEASDSAPAQQTATVISEPQTAVTGVPELSAGGSDPVPAETPPPAVNDSAQPVEAIAAAAPEDSQSIPGVTVPESSPVAAIADVPAASPFPGPEAAEPPARTSGGPPVMVQIPPLTPIGDVPTFQVARTGAVGGQTPRQEPEPAAPSPAAANAGDIGGIFISAPDPSDLVLPGNSFMPAPDSRDTAIPSAVITPPAPQTPAAPMTPSEAMAALPAGTPPGEPASVGSLFATLPDGDGSVAASGPMTPVSVPQLTTQRDTAASLAPASAADSSLRPPGSAPGDADWLNREITSVIPGAYLTIYPKLKFIGLCVPGQGYIRKYNQVAAPADPNLPKIHATDGRTPYGKYYVAGHMREGDDLRIVLSWPSPDDARRAGMGPADLQSVEKAWEEQALPPQDSIAGGGLSITGDRGRQDITSGGFALEKPHLEEIFTALPDGAWVFIQQ